MPGVKTSRWSAVAVLCVGAVGCDRPAASGPAPAPTGQAPAPTVQADSRQVVLAKLQELNDEGLRRYVGDAHTHAEVAGWYLKELHSIDLNGCPEVFMEKFRQYEQAWKALQEGSQASKDEKRGIKSYTIFFEQLKDELKPAEVVHGRDDDKLLATILVRARELARAATGSAAAVVSPAGTPAGVNVVDSPYYPLKIGTTWHYQVGDAKSIARVVKHEKAWDESCALVETEQNGSVVSRQHLCVKDDGVYRVTGDGYRVVPPLLILKLPPENGATWTVDSVAAGVRSKGSFLIGEDRVDVPAGKFQTVTVVSKSFTVAGKGVDLGAVVFTNHFAKGLGPVKSYFKLAGQETVMNLEKFEPGK